MTRLQYRQAARGLALILALLGLAGCSGQPSVQGTVTFDGTPVDDGAISFVPTGGGTGGAGTVGAPIVDGKYTVAGKGVAPGSYRVEIIWRKKTGRKVPTPGDPGNMIDQVVQAIPPQYNTNSTLTRDIKPGTNTLDFDLKSH